MSRPRFGSIYQRTKKLPDGTVRILPKWWIKYHKNGQVFRESSGSEKHADAERLLKRRLGEIVTGKFAGLGPERITVSQLLADLLVDYELHERHSLPMTEKRVSKNLSPAFGCIRAADLSSKHINAYILKRKDEGAAAATINRELELLLRSFRLALSSDPPLVTRVPKIEMLPEDNIRTGTLDHGGYLRCRDTFPPHYRLLLVVGYHTGAREGELLSARWTGVTDGQIRLEAPTTKTKKARALPVYGEMKHWLEMARQECDLKYPDCPWVFQVNGARMTFNWRTWNNLCRLAGVPGLLFHDLRRTALTNMIAAGISEKEAMEVSGHQTRKTFERYHIVSDRNLRRVAARMEEYLLDTLSGTPAPPEKAKLLN